MTQVGATESIGERVGTDTDTDTDTDATTTASRHRRTAIKTIGATLLTASVAGCIIFPPDRRRSGTVPAGRIPSRQELTIDDADVVAATEGELRTHVREQDGRVIWLPEMIDLTGGDLTLRNVVLASNRGGDSPGGGLTTSDEGSSSPVWDGGSNHRGLVECQDNVRTTGIRVLGPHHSETDHPLFPGYIPFMDGPTKSARDQARSRRYARAFSVTGDNVTIDNCEIAYFSVQAITVGTSADTPRNTVVAYTHTHDCAMESLGYGVDVRHGDPLIYRCYMNRHRHAVNGSGMADSNYRVIETTFGPVTCGHITDQHAVKENQSGSSDPSARDYRHRAGGRMLVKRCEFMTPRTADIPALRYAGNPTPHATIRAVPADGFYFEDNRCSHSDISSGIEQRGVPGRYSTDEYGFTNVYVSGNQWDVDFAAAQEVP